MVCWICLLVQTRKREQHCTHCVYFLALYPPSRIRHNALDYGGKSLALWRESRSHSVDNFIEDLTICSFLVWVTSTRSIHDKHIAQILDIDLRGDWCRRLCTHELDRFVIFGSTTVLEVDACDEGKQRRLPRPALAENKEGQLICELAWLKFVLFWLIDAHPINFGRIRRILETLGPLNRIANQCKLLYEFSEDVEHICFIAVLFILFELRGEPSCSLIDGWAEQYTIRQSVLCLIYLWIVAYEVF